MSQLDAIYEEYNAKLGKLLLNTHNVTIKGVREAIGPNGENTAVDVAYDRAIDADNNLDNSYDPDTRYGEREVFVTRHDLNDVFFSVADDIKEAFAEVTGAPTVGVSAPHLTAFLDLVEETHSLTNADVQVVINGDWASIVALPNSLGFIGALNIDMEGASPEGE